MTPAAIHRHWDSSYLLRDLWSARHAILAQLENLKAWNGFVLVDPVTGHSYLRVECTDCLVMGNSDRRYVIAVHHFNLGEGETELHDHRFPFALWPFDSEGHLDEPLYDMPWETRDGGTTTDAGVMQVGWGRPYAIEDHRRVFHAVRSHRQHYSLSFADDRLPPSRPQRSIVHTLDGQRSEEVCRNAAAGLRCVLDEMADEPAPAR